MCVLDGTLKLVGKYLVGFCYKVELICPLCSCTEVSSVGAKVNLLCILACMDSA